MKSNILFYSDKKQLTDVIQGTIFVCFYDKGVKKLVTSKLKITRPHFDKFLNKEFQQFSKTTIINYKLFNETITTLIKEKNPFKEEILPNGYVAFIKDELSFKTNLNTYNTYTYIINSFIEFLATKDIIEIIFVELNIRLFREYKLFLELSKGLTPGTIRYYIIVHKSFINKAVDEELTTINLPLKKLELKRNVKKTTILTDEDIDKLRNVSKSHPLYYFVQFALFQLFSKGLRFSDCLLIKFSDFKPTFLQVQLQKTKTVIEIPYSPMLIDTLYNILCKKFNMKFSLNPLTNKILLDSDSELVYIPKREEIINYIRSKPNNLLFPFANKIFLEYDKVKNMNIEQYDTYILQRVNYNNHLGKLRRSLKLSVDTLTSHSMRYAYIRIALELGIGIHTISKNLGHSNVSITETYIRDNKIVKQKNEGDALEATKYKGFKDIH